MESKIIERHFFFILLAAVFLFTLLIFRPFWVVLALGASFAIVLRPVHERLKRKIPSALSALVTVGLFILIVGIPLFGIGVLVFNQSQSAYQGIAGNVDSLAFIDSINASINRFLPEGISFDLHKKLSGLISLISANLADIFTSTLSAILSLLLTLLSMFYFLKDGARWKEALVSLSPLSDRDDERILRKLAISVDGIIKGYLLIALIQGILMGLGLAVFGVPNPALWGLLSVITALVPTVGTAIVSVPAVLFLLYTGEAMQALGLLIWSGAIVGMVDNFINPYIVGSKINLPPLLVLFSILGGISLLGPVGILIGPLAVSMLYTLISIYREEFREGSEK